jgi:hypothetical protein
VGSNPATPTIWQASFCHSKARLVAAPAPATSRLALNHIYLTRARLTDNYWAGHVRSVPQTGTGGVLAAIPCPANQLAKRKRTMKASKIYIWAVPILAAGSIALTGCGKGGATPTTISYHEIGICKSYEMPTGTAQAHADEGFAIFRIEAIDNSNNNGTFNFNTNRLYVDQSNAEQRAQNVYKWNRHFANPDPRFVESMGVKGLQSATIAAGQKLDPDSFVVVPIGTNNPTGGPEANQYNLELAYDTGTSENQQSVSAGMLFKKTNPPDTKYPVVESCKELALK